MTSRVFSTNTPAGCDGARGVDYVGTENGVNGSTRETMKADCSVIIPMSERDTIGKSQFTNSNNANALCRGTRAGRAEVDGREAERYRRL